MLTFSNQLFGCQYMVIGTAHKQKGVCRNNPYDDLKGVW